MSVKLGYSFSAEPSVAAPYGELQLHNPFFAILAAVRDAGSIGKAAERLGYSYRHLWGVLKKHETAFGEPLLAGGAGQAARLSEFGERLLWAEKRILARVLAQADVLASQIDRDLMLAIDPGLQPIPVAASHDLMFAALRDRLRRHARFLLDVDYVGSGTALERLNDGACSIAGIHLPLADDRLCQRGSLVHVGIGRQLRLGEHKLIRFARREQGLMVARDNPFGIRGIANLGRPEVIFVNRPPASGTRMLFDEMCRRVGLDTTLIAGYGHEEPTHLSVAATVASGTADCGFGLRAAAERFDLSFVPLIVEDYFIVCRAAALESPVIKALIEVLKSENFRRLMDAVPGYASTDSGEIVSLRRTLPWYK